jgi:hypothetical protein
MSQQYPYYLNRQSMIIIISWGNVWQPFVINAELKLLMMNLLSVKNVAIICRKTCQKTCQKKRVLLVKRKIRYPIPKPIPTGYQRDPEEIPGKNQKVKELKLENFSHLINLSPDM